MGNLIFTNTIYWGFIQMITFTEGCSLKTTCFRILLIIRSWVLMQAEYSAMNNYIWTSWMNFKLICLNIFYAPTLLYIFFPSGNTKIKNTLFQTCTLCLSEQLLDILELNSILQFLEEGLLYSFPPKTIHVNICFFSQKMVFFST